MVYEKNKKLRESTEQLEEVLNKYDATPEKVRSDFLAAVKAFEIAVEYGWRDLKFRVEDEGLEAPSPKAAVREAARLGFIGNAELWIECINARNSSVHDYFGIGEDAYIQLAREFLVELKKL